MRCPRAYPRATHEGNKSRNHGLKAHNRLIFTLTRIPQGAQKCTAFFFFHFFFLTIHGDVGVNEAYTRQLDIFDATQSIVLFCLMLTGRW